MILFRMHVMEFSSEHVADLVRSGTRRTVFGLIGGIALPGLKYRKVKQKATLTKDIQLRRRQVIIPLSVGVLLVGVGAGILSIIIGWETILTVRA